MLSTLLVMMLAQIPNWGSNGQCLRMTSNGTSGAYSWGECGGGSGAPTDAEYVTYGANASLSAERVLTSGTNTTVDLSVAGQAKVNFSGTIGNASISDVATTKLSGTVTDAQLASSYSGVGACGANTFASTLNDNAAPTCTQPSFANISGVATAAQIGLTTLSGTTTQSDAVIATYTAITGIAFTPAANTNYKIDCFIVYTSTAATTGINFAFDVPTAALINMDGYTKTVATGANEGFSQNTDNVGTSTSAAVITTENAAVLSAILRNGANATSTTLGFTPETANSVSVIGAKSICQYRIF